MQTSKTYHVLFAGVAGAAHVLVQADSADDAMQRVSVNGQAAVGAALESLRPSFVTQQAGGGGKAKQ